MKMKHLALFAAALSLAACAATPAPTNAPQPAPQHAGHTHAQPEYQQSDAVYRSFECKNGMTVNAAYSMDAVALSVDTMEARTTLAQTRAASGNMYTNNQGFYGKRTEWHEKNGEAYFEFVDAYGNAVNTTCYAK